MESKILEYLNVPSEISDGFPDETKEFIVLVDGMQAIYAAAPDSPKKNNLAVIITQSMRELMKFLQTQTLGIYAPAILTQEQQNLPEPEQPHDHTPRPTLHEPPQQPQPPQPPQPPEPPQGPQPEPPTPPEPEEPQFTKQELEEALDAMAELYNEEDDPTNKREIRKEMLRLRRQIAQFP